MNNIKHIGVLNIYTFPKGMAPTARILAYCRGLMQCGVSCDIISFKPKNIVFGEGPLHECIPEGEYYHFAYSPRKKVNGRIGMILNSIKYRILNMCCSVRALRFILRVNKQNPYDCMILSFDSLRQLYFFVPILHVFGIKLVAIADEYPRPIRDFMKSSVPLWKLWLYRLVYKWIDGRILMTEKLQVFYDRKVSVKPTLILSSIVNIDRFAIIPEAKSRHEYLCYMGNMALTKDNVDNIIEAFALIYDKYPDLQLRLYGTPSEIDKKFLQELIEKLHIGDRCVICGRADYNDVPGILMKAKILVTSQPNTKRAEGGFPTKMGEYFMAGKPTILTNVGEITNYAKDGINSFVVEPENPKKYAEKLCLILDNYENSLLVAKNAKQYIIDNFSSLAAGEKICNYLQNIVSL